MIWTTVSRATLAGFLATSALAGPGHAGEITVWCWDPNFNGAIMQQAGEIFAAAHPGTTLKVVDFAKADVEQKLQTALASGSANALPDIVLIEDYSAQKYLQSFPGAFADLSAKVDFSGFAPYKVGLATVDGAVHAMPFDSGVAGLFYRRDYLEQAGFSPADLEGITWDRYIEIANAVTEKTGHSMIAIDPGDPQLIRIMMQSAGRWYFDADGNLDIAGNEALKASLETMATLAESGAVKTLSGWTEWTGAIGSGDVATVISGVWITGTIKSQADQSGKWGVAPIPALQVEGATHASNLGGSSWYVLEASEEKEEAIDFLNAVFAKDVDFYQTILTERGAVGSLLAARGGEAYQQEDAFFGGQKVWQTFSDWLAQVPAVTYGAFTNEVDSVVVAHMPDIVAGAPVDEVLATIEAEAQGLIH